MRKIDEILVHCAATPEGKDFTVEDIDKWHKARGFKKIGYHFVIYNDGSIHKGRDIEEVGAHCTGHNSRSIGICYIGGVTKDGKTPKDTRTDSQKESLLELLKELRVKYPKAKIYGHRDFAAKACPSFDAKTEYKDI
jgi:N-acetylmuramoyl-L-alanine amidase